MKKIVQLSLIGMLLTLASCNFNKTEVKILTTNCKDEVNRNENLSFTFSENLMPDSLLHAWDSVAYMDFEPPVKGRFKWKATNELVFSPLDILPPSTDFKVTPSKILFKHLSKNSFKLADEQDLSFHTPYLELNNGIAFWKKSSTDNTKATVGGTLNFNYEVNPEAIAKKLEVKIDGKTIPYEILTASPDKKIQFELTKTADELKDAKALYYIIQTGMSVVNSNWTTKKDIKTSVSLSSPAEVRITGVEANHDGMEGSITVTTSQQVDPKNLKSVISLKPSIAFEVQHNANGFSVSSENFDPEKSYELTVTKELAGTFIGKMEEEYSTQVSFGKLEPSITFTHKKSTYLSNKGLKNIGVKIVNVPKVKVKVTKIFENNIQGFFRKGKEYSYRSYRDRDDNWRSVSYRYFDTKKQGLLIHETEYKTDDLERSGKTRLINLDFDDKLYKYEGLYVVEVQDVDRRFITASQVVSFSDIGMIARKEKDKVYVFANSIRNATPISGAEVSFISNTNQKVYTTTTNEEGVAIFQQEKKNQEIFDVAMVSLSKGSDFNYMLFDKTKVRNTRFEVGGKRSNPADYEAFIYGDRDLYRPGETMHVNTLIRTNDWKLPNKIPVKLKLLLPNGKEFKTVRKVLDQQGAAETAFNLPNSTVTGTYALEVYTDNDILLNSKPISVEEFMPDRIKVSIKPDKKETRSGETISLLGNAVNLFGPPATNRNYEVELSLKRKPFTVKDLSGYRFQVSKNKNFGKTKREGKTDEEGKFTENFEIPAGYDNMGLLSGQLLATVFDESGRPVNRVQNFEVYTQDVFFGIGNVDPYVSTKTPLEIPLIAVDKTGKVLDNVPANLQIIRHEWRTVLESSGGGRYRYRSQKKEVVELNKLVKISGKNTAFTYTPSRSGDFEIRITAPEQEAYVMEDFYAYRYGYTENTSFEVNQEGKVDIELDKDSYQVGETANVLFKTPFSGRMLVTLERDNVMKHLYVDTDKKAKQLSFEVTEDFVPNVFVSATLIRPMKDLTIPLTVAHGYAPLMAKQSSNELPIEITAVKKSLSKTKQRIQIKTKPNTNVTLAVVDEGILQIKNYQTPSPYDYFYQKRALNVDAYNIYPYLFPEVAASQPLTGGGGGFDLGKRVNPITNKRVKLVSDWSGILKSDGSGNVDYEVDIPQFSGDLRIMAVAYDEHQFGSADANMKVADPVVISTGLPRFLSPTDTVNVPVTLSNTTAKDIETAVKIKTEGPLKVVGVNTNDTNLKANNENRVEFQVVATAAVGAGKITVSVDALDKQFTEETDISVRPASSLQKISGSGSIKGGQSQNLDMDNEFIPESIDGQVMISRSPIAEFAADLDYLIGYPHGCIEQTISKSFPQLHLADLFKDLNQKTLRTNTGENSKNPNYNVRQAIKKLQSMQVGDGGFSYWRGGSESHWWGSVFAAHFLWEAQKAGFDVHERTFKSVKRYLKKRLKKKETFVYYFYTDEGEERKSQEIAKKEIPYALYVLALMGEPDVPTMNYYKANAKKLLSLDGRYLLASSYMLAGNKARFDHILPTAYEGETPGKALSGSFYSPIRDRAIVLNTLIDADPDHPQVGILAKHLAADFKKERWLNTQERVFTLLAFGKLAKEANKSFTTADILANGKKVGKFKGKNLVLNYDDIKAKQLKVDVKGNGNLYYYWNLEGLNADGSYEEKDNFLKVRREFYDRAGREIAEPTFEQNDLIVVKISLQSTESQSVENVVVTDILPAGLEIENPRISNLPGMDWIKDATTPEHKDFRDDRVHFYTTATNAPRHYYYMVRAVSPGKFKMGPVSADAMYDGEFHSYSGGGTVEVKEKG